MIITGTQIAMARALLHITQQELAELADITRQTLGAIEDNKGGRKDTLSRIEAILVSRGALFLPNEGVCRRPPLEAATLRGREGLRSFYDDVYESTRETGKEIFVFNGIPNQLINWAGEEWYSSHAERMKALNCVSKNIVEEGEINLIGKSFAQYKAFPKDDFYHKTIYVYGHKFGFISFENDDVLLKIIEDPEIAESFRILINTVWENTATELS